MGTNLMLNAFFFHFSHLILTTTLKKVSVYIPIFTDEETMAQRE